jgi:hypothetical protein
MADEEMRIEITLAKTSPINDAFTKTATRHCAEMYKRSFYNEFESKYDLQDKNKYPRFTLTIHCIISEANGRFRVD